MSMCVSLCRCGCVCMNSYCLLGDYVMLNTILNVHFAEMYVNVVFVKLFELVL